MLESLEQNNIKRMSVEQSEKTEALFDFQRDISSADWQEIQIAYEGLINGPEDTDKLMSMTYGISKFDPNNELIKGALPRLKMAIERMENSEKPDWSEIAFYYKCLHKAGLDIATSDNFRENVRKRLIELKAKEDWIEYATLSSFVKGLVDGIDFREHKDEIQNRLDELIKKGNYRDYAATVWFLMDTDEDFQFTYNDELKIFLMESFKDDKAKKNWSNVLVDGIVMQDFYTKLGKHLNPDTHDLPEQRSF